MNLHNGYIEPGPYRELITNETIVVLEVVNYAFNVTAQRQQPIEDPVVIWRQLMEDKDNKANKHQRFSMPLSEFNKHFQQIR